MRAFLVALCMALTTVIPHSYADIVTSYQVSAQIDASLDMAIWLMKVTESGGQSQYEAASSMDFGMLSDNGYGILTSGHYYQVMFKASSSGMNYKIQQSSTPSGTAIDYAIIATPFFSPQLSMMMMSNGQQTMVTNADLGYTNVAGSAVGKAQLAFGQGKDIDIFTSQSGEAPVIGCAYGFVDGDPQKMSTVNTSNGTPKPLIVGKSPASVGMGMVTFTITQN
jgi:hypothetical protein